jgi:arsenate reductase (glutaredoxin)
MAKDDDFDADIDSDVEIYHNPKCSKSRATLQLLRDRGIEPDIIEYLDMPPDRRELELLLEWLGIGVRDLIRTKEPIYKQLGLDKPGVDDDALIDAIVENPILMERPVVVANGKARLGRPPENVLEIL